MMDLKMEVYTGELELLGILEQFDALIFEEKAFTAGSFSVECLMTNETLSLLRPDSILWIAGETAGIIEYIQKQADKNGPYMTVKGRLLSGILDRRILWGRYDLYDTVPAIMTALVDDCAVHPSRGNLETRKIPGLVCLDAPSIGDKIRIQRTGGTLLETLEELGTAYQIAFGIQFNPKIPRMEFWTRPGQDRSIHQDAHEPVFYSTELDDVLQSEYLYNSIDYRNVTLVGGEGEGPNRIYVTVGDGTSETPDNPMPSIPEDPGAYTVILKIDPDGSGTISGGGTFKGGEYVIITATPSIGYKFAYWQENGQSISTAQNYTFMINKNRNLTAVFSLLTYNIATSVDSSGGGAVSGAGSYQQGTSVTVTAIPNEHYQFVAWKENGMTVSTTANYTFTVSKSRALVATFSIISYSITTSIDPSGSGSASGAGTYNHGTDVTVKATPSTGYKFVAWKENGTTVSTNASYTFTMSGSRNLTAVFSIIAYNVTTSIDPSSSGSVSGAGTYNHGTSVTVKATPSTGYKFVAWKENGTTVSTNASYTFTMSGNRNLTAVFSIVSYNITTSIDPSGSGSTTGAGTYNHGTSVTVKATPSTGYKFVAWKENGTTVSTNASYTFTMSGSRNLTAVFSIIAYNVTTSIDPSSSGSVSGAGTYNHGTSVTVKATPSTGYKFVAWKENGTTVSTNANYTFTVGKSRTLTAVFAVITYHITASVDPSGSGSVSGAGTYRHGTSVTVIATPSQDYQFVAWKEGGVIVSTSASYTFTVSQNKTLTAVFEVAPVEGLDWKPSTLPVSAWWRGIAYGNGKFVAIAESSAAAYSTDGINWTKTTLPSSSGSWHSVTYGNGKFVAVTTSGNAAYSTDGINWTATKFPSPGSCYSITYGNGKFVLITTSSSAAYSTDGINWTKTTLPSYGSWYSVTYGNGKFVAVRFYSSEAAYSTDGINWTKATLPSFEQWYSITYGNEKFVAVAGGPDGSYGTAVAAYSSDGVNWTAAKFPSTACWNSVVYGNKKFVTVAYTSKAAATNLSAYSMDGINWTTSKLPSNKMWSCVAYGNKKFVAIAFGEVKSNTAYQSNASAYSK